MSHRIEVPDYTGESMDLEALGIRHGFRYDPMEWVNNDRDIKAARLDVFGQQLEGDREVLDARVDEVLAGGGNADVRLNLGCAKDRPEFRARLDEVCSQHVLAPDRPPWFHEEAPALWAALRYGWERDNEPKNMLIDLVTRVTGAHLLDCDPWAWGRTFGALWEGRHLVDTVPKTGEYLHDNVNIADCLVGGSPWATLMAVSIPDHPLCRDIVPIYIPLILRSQDPATAWGWDSVAVLNALVKTGLIARLRELPPLPPDWRIVRSIPAPEGDLRSLTWEGEHLWTVDTETCDLIALDPGDGAVVKRVKAPLQGRSRLGGICRYRDMLAITVGGNEHKAGKAAVLLLDPEDFSVRGEISIKGPWGPHGGAQAGNELWIAHYGWLCVVNPKTGKWRDGGNPASWPLDIACDGDALWVVDESSPFVYRIDLQARYSSSPKSQGRPRV